MAHVHHNAHSNVMEVINTAVIRFADIKNLPVIYGRSKYYKLAISLRSQISQFMHINRCQQVNYITTTGNTVVIMIKY
jgi:hypothetical protein